MNPSQLPADILYELHYYLCVSDLISLSQTCNSFRRFYGPLSWKVCLPVEADTDHPRPLGNEMVVKYESYPQTPSVPFANQDSNKSRVRIAPCEACVNPEKYSWFLQDCVETLVFDNFGNFQKHLISKPTAFHTKFCSLYTGLKHIDLSVVQGVHLYKLRYLQFDETPLMKFVQAKLMVNWSLGSEPPLLLNQDLPLEKDIIPSEMFKSPSFQSNITHLSINSSNFNESRAKYINFGTQGLDELLINVNNPLDFNKVLSVFSQISRCDKLILVIHYGLLLGPRYFDIFKYLPNIPANASQTTLVFRQVTDDTYMSMSYLTHYLPIQDLFTSFGSQKPVLDKITALQDFPEKDCRLLELATFPSLYQYEVATDHSFILSLANLHAPSFFDSITHLSLSSISWPLVYISKFRNLTDLRMETTHLQQLHTSQSYLDTLKMVAGVANWDHFFDVFSNVSPLLRHDTSSLITENVFPEFQKIANIILSAEYPQITLDEIAEFPHPSPQTDYQSSFQVFFLDCLFAGLNELTKLKSLVLNPIYCHEYVYNRLEHLMKTPKSLANVLLLIDQKGECCSCQLKNQIPHAVSSKIKCCPVTMQRNGFLCVEYFPRLEAC